MQKSLSLFTVAVLAGLLLSLPRVAAAADCAFEDVNDNGVFDAGDIIVTQAQWLGMTEFVTNNPFVVPVGCDHTLTSVSAPLYGVRVIATKITFLGKLNYLPAGGRGVLLIADPTNTFPLHTLVPQPPGLGDGSITVGDGTVDALIEAGGASTLYPLNSIPAIPKRAVALLASDKCNFNKAQIHGNRPVQNTQVGIYCLGDITFRGSEVIGSRVNIQSQGVIDAKAIGSGAPLDPGISCDDPIKNLVNGAAAPGNGNGVLDAGDFPCQVQVNNKVDILTFCTAQDVAGRNVFQAFNDPLIMISKGLLDLSGGLSRNEVLGRYRITLAAEDGNINTTNADVNHGPPPPPGGASIYVFADPTAINRLQTDREDFTGPSAGTVTITGACYASTNPVQVGQNAGGNLVGVLVGVPSADPACAQNPPDFVPILSKNF